MSSQPITVSPTPPRVKGDHWHDAKGSAFLNPWSSSKDVMGGFSGKIFLAGMIREINAASAEHDARDRPIINQLVPSTKPDWGRREDSDKLKATWMGHASYLLEMPVDKGHSNLSATSNTLDEKVGGQDRGVTVLFDPAYSERCSPVQFTGGFKRYHPAPATVAELPEIDVIAISHSHYDHQDNNTLTEIYKRFSHRPPVICVGLNGGGSLPSNIPKDKVLEMDWWDSREITVEGKGKVQLTCTPAQHGSARGMFDRDRALWASYALKNIPSSGVQQYNVWFGGDTGYRYTPNEGHDPNQDLDRPHCPAFKQIGDKLGPFNLALIPIGAYAPRRALSNVHASPLDALRMFKDVNAKRAIGIHWGTWHMAADAVAEPPQLLAEARKALNVSEKEFGTVVMGKTEAIEP